MLDQGLPRLFTMSAGEGSRNDSGSLEPGSTIRHVYVPDYFDGRQASDGEGLLFPRVQPSSSDINPLGLHADSIQQPATVFLSSEGIPVQLPSAVPTTSIDGMHPGGVVGAPVQLVSLPALTMSNVGEHQLAGVAPQPQAFLQPLQNGTMQLISIPTPAVVPVPVQQKSAKKKRKMKPRQYYSEDEERAFLDGLELYGRDWKKLEDHMHKSGFPERTANNLRSKAQKHFIRLMRDKKSLPVKVLETGNGYTLSGKPLNLNSAAVKTVLGKDFDPKPYAILTGCILGNSTEGTLGKDNAAYGSPDAGASGASATGSTSNSNSAIGAGNSSGGSAADTASASDAHRRKRRRSDGNSEAIAVASAAAASGASGVVGMFPPPQMMVGGTEVDASANSASVNLSGFQLPLVGSAGNMPILGVPNVMMPSSSMDFSHSNDGIPVSHASLEPSGDGDTGDNDVVGNGVE